MNAIGNKKGSILVQLPASIKISYFQRVRQLLEQLAEKGMTEGWHLAIEFRDRSWYVDKVCQMLERYKAVVVVVHDMPKSCTPVIDMERNFVYLRFHGAHGDYRGGLYPRFFTGIRHRHT